MESVLRNRPLYTQLFGYRFSLCIYFARLFSCLFFYFSRDRQFCTENGCDERELLDFVALSSKGKSAVWLMWMCLCSGTRRVCDKPLITHDRDRRSKFAPRFLQPQFSSSWETRACFALSRITKYHSSFGITFRPWREFIEVSFSNM